MITVQFKRTRMLVTGHADKWFCAAITYVTQTCAYWTNDRRFKHRRGRSDVRVPTGIVGRYIRDTLTALAATHPKQVRVLHSDAANRKRRPRS